MWAYKLLNLIAMLYGVVLPGIQVHDGMKFHSDQKSRKVDVSLEFNFPYTVCEVPC